jgi:hypothetical protein
MTVVGQEEIRFMFQAIVTKLPSARTLSSPRNFALATR